MTRGILIAGNESTLAQALAVEAAKRVEHYGCALIPSRVGGQSANTAGAAGTALAGTASAVKQKPIEKGALPLEWNPASPISARTLTIAAENRLGQVNEAILVCTPPAVRNPAAELPLADIEILVNDHIKGWFFLVRELTAAFRTRGSGTLALVYSETGMSAGKDDQADMLGPAALGAFQSFSRSLLNASHNEPYSTLGFSCSEAGAEAAFATYIFKIIDEGNKRDNGKLHKYGKFNLFK